MVPNICSKDRLSVKKIHGTGGRSIGRKNDEECHSPGQLERGGTEIVALVKSTTKSSGDRMPPDYSNGEHSGQRRRQHKK